MLHVRVVSQAADHGALRHETAPVWEMVEAEGSMLQLLLNVILLIVVGAAGLSSQRAIWRRRSLRPRSPPAGDDPQAWRFHDGFVTEHYDVIVVGSGAGLSIGAVNPALTAMANAIRVGEHPFSRMS